MPGPRSLRDAVTEQVAAVTDAYHQLLSDPSVGVHQMRVTMRRLRSTLLVFAAKAPQGALAYQLRDAARELSHLRDVEVIEQRVALNTGEDFEALHHQLERLRRSTGTAAQVLSSPRFAALFADLADLVSHPFPDLSQEEVQAKLRKELRRAERRLRAAVDGPDEHRDVRLHEARKAVKRARYVLEDFSLHSEDQQAVAELIRAQDELGLWQDAVVQRTLIGSASGHTAEEWDRMKTVIGQVLDRLEPAISVRSPS